MKRTVRTVAAMFLVLPLMPGAAVRAQTDSRSGAQGALAAKSDDVQHDTDFIRFAALSSLAEVELGRLAQMQAMSPEVKQFAAQMITDHTQATQMLTQSTRGSGAPLPTQLDDKHKNAMQKLQQMSGAEFDRAYMQMMVDDHREAVDRFASAAGVLTNETRNGPVPAGDSAQAASSRRDTGAGASASSGSSTSDAGSSSAQPVATSGQAPSAAPQTVQQFAAMSLPILRTHLQMAEAINSRVK